MDWTIARLVAEFLVGCWILWRLIRQQEQEDALQQLRDVKASRERLRRVVASLPHGGPWEDTRAILRPSDLRDITPLPKPQLVRFDA